MSSRFIMMNSTRDLPLQDEREEYLRLYECDSEEQAHDIVENGLPVEDRSIPDLVFKFKEGKTTDGIRYATEEEVRSRSRHPIDEYLLFQEWVRTAANEEYVYDLYKKSDKVLKTMTSTLNMLYNKILDAGGRDNRNIEYLLRYLNDSEMIFEQHKQENEQ